MNNLIMIKQQICFMLHARIDIELNPGLPNVTQRAAHGALAFTITLKLKNKLYLLNYDVL